MTAKQAMQAIRVHQFGGPEQLKLEQIPRPEPQAGEVLIRVYAAGVLPADYHYHVSNRRRRSMSITIDHVVIPAHDHEASAQFFAQIMGLAYRGPDRHFAPVQVSDTFTVSFIKVAQFTGYHLGFHISEDDFDAILSHLQSAGVRYGNDPRDHTNLRTDHPFGGRGVFFMDANAHLFEVMTKVRP